MDFFGNLRAGCRSHHSRGVAGRGHYLANIAILC